MVSSNRWQKYSWGDIYSCICWYFILTNFKYLWSSDYLLCASRVRRCWERCWWFSVQWEAGAGGRDAASRGPGAQEELLLRFTEYLGEPCRRCLFVLLNYMRDYNCACQCTHVANDVHIAVRIASEWCACWAPFPWLLQLCETLKRDSPKVHIAAIEIANEGICIRFAPMESIHGKNTDSHLTAATVVESFVCACRAVQLSSYIHRLGHLIVTPFVQFFSNRHCCAHARRLRHDGGGSGRLPGRPRSPAEHPGRDGATARDLPGDRHRAGAAAARPSAALGRPRRRTVSARALFALKCVCT